MKPGFEIVEGLTSADIALRLWGNSIEDVMHQAAAALLAVLLENPNSVQEQSERELAVEAESEEMLLYRFLDELVFLKDAKKMLVMPKQLAVLPGLEDLAGKKGIVLRGVFLVDYINHSRHRFNVDIKAITMHGLSFAKRESGYEAHVVVDV
jgi:SHS2 domain-containing protein